jgi:hypothetical protein
MFEIAEILFIVFVFHPCGQVARRDGVGSRGWGGKTVMNGYIFKGVHVRLGGEGITVPINYIWVWDWTGDRRREWEQLMVVQDGTVNVRLVAEMVPKWCHIPCLLRWEVWCYITAHLRPTLFFVTHGLGGQVTFQFLLDICVPTSFLSTFPVLLIPSSCTLKTFPSSLVHLDCWV